jgi:hypothetical protein
MSVKGGMLEINKAWVSETLALVESRWGKAPRELLRILPEKTPERIQLSEQARANQLAKRRRQQRR